MARTTTNTQPKKKEKPQNEKHKTVYFNTKNANDAALFKYAQSVGVRNFSGFVKSLIYQEMVRREGRPPNPYEYATLPMTHVSEPAEEQIREDELPTIPVKVKKPAAKNTRSKDSNEDEVRIVVGGKDLTPKEEEPEEIVEEEEEVVAKETEEVDAQNEESEVEEETEVRTSRSALAKGLLGQFKR